MADYCQQQTTAHGPRESRDRLVSSAVDENGNPALSTLHPMPEELGYSYVGFTADEDARLAIAEKQAAFVAKYGHPDWYSWALAEWGTKTGDCGTSIIAHGESYTTYEYDSAYGPPSALIAKISALFPDLIFSTTYVDESSTYAGVIIHRDGRTLQDTEVDIPDFDWSKDGEDDEKRHDWEDSYINEMNDVESTAVKHWLATA